MSVNIYVHQVWWQHTAILAGQVVILITKLMNIYSCAYSYAVLILMVALEVSFSCGFDVLFLQSFVLFLFLSDEYEYESHSLW